MSETSETSSSFVTSETSLALCVCILFHNAGLMVYVSSSGLLQHYVQYLIMWRMAVFLCRSLLLMIENSGRLSRRLMKSV